MQSIQFSDATSNAPVDLALLFEAVGGLEEEARALITIYREQASDLFERLAKAVAESNGPDIEHLAHKLAGSSASCGMTLLVGPLRDLENTARAGELTSEVANQLYSVARQRYTQVDHFLRSVFA